MWRLHEVPPEGPVRVAQVLACDVELRRPGQLCEIIRVPPRGDDGRADALPLELPNRRQGVDLQAALGARNEEDRECPPVRRAFPAAPQLARGHRDAQG